MLSRPPACSELPDRPWSEHGILRRQAANGATSEQLRRQAFVEALATGIMAALLIGLACALFLRSAPFQYMMAGLRSAFAGGGASETLSPNLCCAAMPRSYDRGWCTESGMPGGRPYTSGRPTCRQRSVAWCTGGAAGLAAALVLFPRPRALWAPGCAARQQRHITAPGSTGAAPAVRCSAPRWLGSGGGGRRVQLAAASVLSSEVDEADEEPAPVDPEQAKAHCVRVVKSLPTDLVQYVLGFQSQCPHSPPCCVWGYYSTLELNTKRTLIDNMCPGMIDLGRHCDTRVFVRSRRRTSSPTNTSQ